MNSARKTPKTFFLITKHILLMDLYGLARVLISRSVPWKRYFSDLSNCLFQKKTKNAATAKCWKIPMSRDQPSNSEKKPSTA